ncbi:Mycothiol S-conjugate amidase [Botrimarina colliarenosi]|uniref:Mycothiol S-conjugate amidase n=1 Tax=Botrimarina colliarenosi TaxID=2528001 RepID=A0A5C6A8Q4_9BACT|nr:PIG-L family deacetylase [Botrimarina colliarenosi]TWT95939.1 Mycothiol S-conjugate amidase [Botrimarina colliarenosi]
MPSETDALDVIAVGAHPDDVEIGCGGTLAKLVEQGYRVGIVDLTDGEPTPASPGPDVRLAEARTAAEVLGVHERFTLPLTNRRLFDGFDERVALAKVFRKWRPKLVLGLGDRTPMASPDHWQAMQITDAAIFYSRLTKWDEKFDGLAPHTISAQIYYPLTFYTLQPPPTANDFVMDIGSTLEKKLAAIRAYETQFPPAKQDLFDRVRAMNVAVGNAAGFAAGERLASPRALGVTDLMASLRL